MTIPRTMLLLHFAEPIDTAQPADAMGQLEPLSAIDPDDALITMPAVEPAFTGVGRYFNEAALTAVAAVDAAAGDTLSTRDVTIRAVCQVLLGTSVTPRVLIARGDSSSAAEYIAYGLEVYWLAPTLLELRFFWQDSSGVLQTQVGGVFEYTMPASANRSSAGFFYFAATRRWVSSTEVVCRYYVNGQQIAEVTSVDGDIGGGTTGHTSVGAVKNLDSAGSFSRYWEGIVDEIQVDNYEASREELKADWDRLTIHQVNGVRAVQALMPPGSNWADQSTRWGKLTRIAGQLVGFGWSKIEELRANWLPDRAYQGWIGRWEKFLGIAPGAADSLDTRRARCVAYLQRDNGYSVEQLQEVLAEPLDLDAGDVAILELSNTITDSFATLEEERWMVGDGEGGAAVWDIASGALRLAVGNAKLVRWNGVGFERSCCVTPLTSDGHGPGSGNGALTLTAKLTVETIGATGLITGVAMYNGRSKRLLVFGPYDDAGTTKLGYYYFDGEVASAIVEIEDPIPSLPIWLRLRAVHHEFSPYQPKQWKIGWSVTSAVEGFTETTVNDIMADPEWAGFWVTCGVVTDDTSTVRFDDLELVDAGGKRPFCWYAYADPGLGGSPNLELANRMIRSGLRPAHTHGAAIASKSVLCADPELGRCDRGPMGAVGL